MNTNGKRRYSGPLNWPSIKRRRSISVTPSSRNPFGLRGVSNFKGRRRNAGTPRRGGRIIRSRSTGRKRSSANNTRTTAIRKRGKSVRKEARKKSVRVPPRLRKQVKQVLASEDLKGTYQEILVPRHIKPLDNLQNVQMANLRFADSFIGLHFDPTTVVNIASQLFNNAGPNAAQDFNPFAVTNLYNMNSLKINVVDSSVKYIMRNNTTNNLTVKIWDISPKSVSTNASLYLSPITWINNECVRYAPANVPPGTGLVDELNRYNPFNVNVNTIGFNPKMLPSFNQFYAMDETIIELEPGKTYIHHLPGPKNKLYDYRKFFQNGSVTMNTYQKFCKQTMICVIGDLQGTDTGNVGRFTDIAPITSGYGLLVEARTFYKLRVPEQTGFIAQAVPPAGGQSQGLTNRRDSFIIKNWTPAQTGTIQRIGDENEAVDAPSTS